MRFFGAHLWCKQSIREGEGQVDFLVLKVVSMPEYQNRDFFWSKMVRKEEKSQDSETM